jgi:hypothetical protein
MSKIVITIEVDLIEEELDIFTPTGSIPVLIEKLDSQADFVKDALRNPNNKIDWKLRR